MPPRAVEQLGVDDRSDRPVDVVAADPLEERQGTRARDLELRERRLVEQPRGRARRERLRRDRGRPVPAGPAARTQRLERRTAAEPRVVRVRLEPVRPLPARLLAEHGPERRERLVRRRRAQRPSGLALLVRVVDVVVGRVHLGRPRERVALRPVRGPEPADVHPPDVELGLAVDDPARDLAADARRPRRCRGRRTRPRPRSRAPRSRRG